MADTGGSTSLSAWEQLRNRKVVQWGLAYVAASWALVQGLAFLSGVFHWPDLLTRIAVVVAIAGLPVAVTLAWFHGDRGYQRVTRPEIALVILLLAIGAYAVQREYREAAVSGSVATPAASGAARARLDRHRIAILPFDNLGGAAANAAFVGGVHDTLITQVAKIPGLSVISRSSVLQYADRRPTISEVASALNVGAVLEGSVEREGDSLRIQAQLIDAATDAHLWAETYDRSAKDLFAVQSEIAQAVAAQLRIHLTSDDARRLKASLTTVPEAYDHYVLGRNFLSQWQWADAIREMEEAVRLDPKFAAAYAQLSLAHTWNGFNHPRNKEQEVAAARTAVDTALALDPALPQAHLALATYYYRGAPDIERAAAEFEKALPGLPNDAVAHSNFGLLRRYQGRWEEAAALFDRSVQLDPRSASADGYPMALVTLGRKDEALAAFAALSRARPDEIGLAIAPGYVAMNFSCDLDTFGRVLAQVAARAPGSQAMAQDQAYYALMTGHFDDAVQSAARMPVSAEEIDVELIWLKGLAYRLAGRQKESSELLQRNLRAYEREMQSIPESNVPSDWFAAIAMRRALLGQKQEAREYAARALRALPPSGDAVNRTVTTYYTAVALAWADDPEQAVANLREMLSAPSLYKPAYLWCDPYLAPLRKEPSFRKLLADRGVDLGIDPYRRETWPKH